SRRAINPGRLNSGTRGGFRFSRLVIFGRRPFHFDKVIRAVCHWESNSAAPQASLRQQPGWFSATCALARILLNVSVLALTAESKMTKSGNIGALPLTRRDVLRTA